MIALIPLENRHEWPASKSIALKVIQDSEARPLPLSHMPVLIKTLQTVCKQIFLPVFKLIMLYKSHLC